MIQNLDEEVLQQKFEASDPRQAELVKRYCGALENRVRTASSEIEARRIVHEACQTFDFECESNAIKVVLRQYAFRLLADHWDVKS